jgi:large subunit ribosomal protein L21
MSGGKMYAIIETGGKQYRVEKGDVIDIELIEPIKENAVEFKNVLFFHSGSEAKVGLPYVQGCLVQGELLGETKGPKVIAYKYKRRRNYYRKRGHRQKYSSVKITEIKG